MEIMINCVYVVSDKNLLKYTTGNPFSMVDYFAFITMFYMVMKMVILYIQTAVEFYRH